MAETTDDGLRLIVERIERLLEERRGISDDIRGAFAEAKAVGYDTKTIRKLIARRALAPGDRAEADLMLETYEAALGMGQSEYTIAELQPDAAKIALAMLSEQVAGLEDSAQAELLVGHVLHIIDLRIEIAELRQQEADTKKLAKAEGFEPKQIASTVRWFEKCAKHGEDAMRAGEATYHLYRSTVEASKGVGKGAGERGPVTQDAKLAAVFGGPKQSGSGKLGAADKAMIWASLGGPK